MRDTEPQSRKAQDALACGVAKLRFQVEDALVCEQLRCRQALQCERSCFGDGALTGLTTETNKASAHQSTAARADPR